MVEIGDLLRRARETSGLSRAELARRAGTSRSALHDYERGARLPRADGLLRVLDASGARVRIDFAPRSPQGTALAGFVTGLGAQPSDQSAWAWRTLISDFVANEFVPATRSERRGLLRAEPPLIGDLRWDAFVGALAEHVAFHAGIDPPHWTAGPGRQRSAPFWWPVHGRLSSQRAAAMANSPAAFRRRAINVDGREIPRISP